MQMFKLKQMVTQFKNFLKGNKRSASTIVAYSNDIEQLIAFLEEQQKNSLEQVLKEDIETFLAKLTKNGYTPKSVSRKLNSIRTFYRFLKLKGYEQDDPSILVTHPTYELAAPRILNPTEYRALRDATRNDPRMYAIIELFLQTGIRIGELANLRLSDVRKDSLYIRPFEKHQARTITLNKRAFEAVKRYLEIRPKNGQDYLFVTKTGRPFLIRNIRTVVERYLKICEIKKAKVNDLRHTFVAHHLKHGVSLTLLSQMLGHKRLSTTERYLIYVKDRAKETTVLSEL